jgi:hypothetical protein
LASFSRVESRRGASSSWTVVSPFFEEMVTGTISSGRPAGVGRLGPALVAAQRPLVEVRAGHLELVADLGGLLVHLLARERVAQAVLDHRVERLDVAHAEAEARLGQQVGRVAHRLHAARDRRCRGRRRGSRRRSMPRRGCLRQQTLLIVSDETSFGDAGRRSGPWRDGNLTLAGLDHRAHHDVLDLLGLDRGALERGLDGDATELGPPPATTGRPRACRPASLRR